MINDKVDILLATYNGEKYLAEQLDSILLQTHQNFQIIIRDDGSKDRTLAIIKEYQANYPTKLKLITDQLGNLGVIKNFEILLRASESKYLLFADQDDFWLENKVADSLKKIKEIEEDEIPSLVFTDLKVVDQNLKLINNSFWNYQKINPENKSLNCLLNLNCMTGCTIIINQELKNLALPIPKEVLMHDLWLGLIASSLGKVAYLNQATVLYRQHNNNELGAIGLNLKAVLKHLFNYQKFFKEIRRIKKLRDGTILQAKILAEHLSKLDFVRSELQKKRAESLVIIEKYANLKKMGKFARMSFFYKNKMFCGDLIIKLTRLLFY